MSTLSHMAVKTSLHRGEINIGVSHLIKNQISGTELFLHFRSFEIGFITDDRHGEQMATSETARNGNHQHSTNIASTPELIDSRVGL